MIAAIVSAIVLFPIDGSPSRIVKRPSGIRVGQSHETSSGFTSRSATTRAPSSGPP